MPARPVLALLTKWLLVPGAVAAAGYFVLGPRVPQMLGHEPKKIEATRIADEVAAEPRYSEPQVTVTSERLRAAPRAEPSRPRRRTRPQVRQPAQRERPAEVVPADIPPPADAPPPDDPPVQDPPAAGAGDGTYAPAP
ncbi:MAG TPA: hypothetical protein VM328_13465 [Fimbriimonadaceae bacterium]|nr:hypothetical protein [Fimbriimonadaceae bacterium]